MGPDRRWPRQMQLGCNSVKCKPTTSPVSLLNLQRIVIFHVFRAVEQLQVIPVSPVVTSIRAVPYTPSRRRLCALVATNVAT